MSKLDLNMCQILHNYRKKLKNLNYFGNNFYGFFLWVGGGGVIPLEHFHSYGDILPKTQILYYQSINYTWKVRLFLRPRYIFRKHAGLELWLQHFLSVIWPSDDVELFCIQNQKNQLIWLPSQCLSSDND